MMRTLAIIGMLLALAGCSSAPEGNAWYQLGDANYDALKAAHDACVDKGGKFQLKSGGEPTHLGDYECLMPKGT
jgi:hypothetical protein